MPIFCPLADTLPAEHAALCREYAAVQERCSRVIALQRAEIERLQAQTVRLRAAVIVRDTALALVREDHARIVARWKGERDSTAAAAADQVICQTGCLGHGDYWREQDHCRRTGHSCVLADAAKLTV